MNPLKIKCNLCTYRTDTFAHLRTHLQTYHEDCNIGYECFFCSKHLKSPYDHREHLRRRHGDHCDFTTPPPTGRIDPKKSAKMPKRHLPPMEARLMPQPPKRRRSEPGSSQQANPPTQVFNLDVLLNEDLHISDEETEITSTDKCIQVRRRDFLTTSREVQATAEMTDGYTQVQLHNNTTEMSTQTVSTTTDCMIQTMNLNPLTKSSSTQTTLRTESVDACTQVTFFNGGWLTRHLMDAVRAIAPTIMSDSMTTSIRATAPIRPSSHQPDSAETTRRGRPRSHHPLNP